MLEDAAHIFSALGLGDAAEHARRLRRDLVATHAPRPEQAGAGE